MLPLISIYQLKTHKTRNKNPRGRLPSEKNRDMCSLEILKRTPKRYQDPVLWAWLEFFLPLRATNSKATHNLQSKFFLAQYLKGKVKLPLWTF